MTSHMRYAARSDVGLQRSGNEDSGFADDRLLMVADGMGGHAAGELASAMAVATFAELADAEVPADEMLEQLAAAVEVLSDRLRDVIAEDPSNQGMGTTITGLAWEYPRVAIVHVGDSRAYLLREGRLAQLTKDHTYVQALVDAGEITAQEAARHPRRNLLNRAVDGIHPVEADLSVREARAGDRFLLCTDGLSGVVADGDLADVLSSVADPTGAVTRLVDMALEAGAPDNVTVVVADVIADNGVVEDAAASAVVVGAAGEPKNRARLPNVPWPVDEQLDPENPRPRHDFPPPTPGVGAAPPGPGDQQHRRTWLTAALALVGLVVALLAALGLALSWWVSQQWYVAEADGFVAVYQGVEGNLGPIPLQRVEEVYGTLPVADLPESSADSLARSIDVESLDAAREIVTELRNAAAACAARPKERGCPPVVPAEPPPPSAASPSPSPSPSPR
jgi:protein phosphatase